MSVCPYHGRKCSEVHGHSELRADVFLAYPGKPIVNAEALRNAGRQLAGGTELRASVIDWQDLDIEGANILCKVCEGIRSSSSVVVDITGFNFNVMFEFGFALALGKPVWPLLAENESTTAQYARFHTFTTIGYSSFRNSADIIKKLAKKDNPPWRRRPAFQEIPAADTQMPVEPVLLYVTSDYQDESSLCITDAVRASKIRAIVDDTNEVAFRPLSEYHKWTASCTHVIIDTGTGQARDSALHWARCAIVAGLAVGSGREVLVLAATGNPRPIDYHDLVFSYKNSNEAERKVKAFLQPVVAMANERLFGPDQGRFVVVGDTASPLASVNLGDYIAENESGVLERYFLETPQFVKALLPGFHLIVGRKGTGKSAIASELVRRLREANECVVVHFVPKHYELDALLHFVLEVKDVHTQEYLLESVWKYAILTEAIRTLMASLDSKDLFESWSKSEQRLTQFIKAEQDLLDLPFSHRIRRLLSEETRKNTPQLADNPTSISQRLHTRVLGEVLELVLEYLVESERSIAFIADGLDSNWLKASDRNMMSRILLSLLNAGNDVRRRFSPKLNSLERPLSAHFVVMMRSDIFRGVQEVAPERDKLGETVLAWKDEDVILRLIGRRIADSLNLASGQVFDWETILSTDWHYQDLRDYVLKAALLRPRDAIFLFRQAISEAVVHQHHRLSRKHFEAAEDQYSQYVFDAISAEWHPAVREMADFLLTCFMDRSATISEQDLHEIIRAEGAVEPAKVRDVIQFLVDSSFLGVAIGDAAHKYATTPADQTTLRMRMARSTGARTYQVHRAYRSAIGVKT